jgi:hypothetical protein
VVNPNQGELWPRVRMKPENLAFILPCHLPQLIDFVLMPCLTHVARGRPFNFQTLCLSGPGLQRLGDITADKKPRFWPDIINTVSLIFCSILVYSLIFCIMSDLYPVKSLLQWISSDIEPKNLILLFFVIQLI